MSTARLVLLTALAGPAFAQGTIPINDPGIKAAFAAIQRWNAWTLQQQVELCEIPAPPFKETARGVEFRKRMINLGYRDTKVDAVGNVIAERPGRGNGPTVLLSGHLDTVFPEGTDVKVKRNGTRFDAPGIGDDCRGLAVVLAVARALNEAKIETAGTVILVGNVGEEGPGNLRGVRELFTNGYPGKIDRFISADGLGLRVTARAVGSNRYNVQFVGPGGHSYGAFGTPSAIHAMGRAIAKISDIQVPTDVKTTFNVGVVKGGQTVNSIAGESSMEVDMRSESVANLAKVDQMIHAAIDSGVAGENARWPRAARKVSVKYDTIGIRPVGKVPQTDATPIVRTALDAARAMGEADLNTGASSTDSNLPMSMGIPAITIGGGGRGGDAHALTEWYDDGPAGYKGPQWALLIVTALAGLSGRPTP